MRIATALLGLVCSTQPLAATFVVTRTDDPAPGACLRTDCSLREAIQAANARSGADIVRLGSGIHLLTRVGEDASGASGELRVTDDVEIVGAGISKTRIRWSQWIHGGHSHRLLSLGAAGSKPMATGIRDLTLSHGRGSWSGCVQAEQNVEPFLMQRVVVENCVSASSGGGIGFSSPELTLVDVEVRDNSAGYDGGGIRLGPSSTLHGSGLVVHRNRAGRNGGGIHSDRFVLYASPTSAALIADGDVWVHSNEAGSSGGGIAVTGDVDLSIVGNHQLVVARNTAGATGGGLWRGPRFYSNERRALRVWDADIDGNLAHSGGGIAAQQRLQLSGVQLRDNTTSGGDGGGVFLEETTGEATLLASALTDNVARQGGGIHARCHSVDLQNVSLQGNEAIEGSAAWLPGGVALTHVTVNTHAGNALRFPYDTACAQSGAFARITNSLILGACASGHGAVTSGGGNQYGPSASACPRLAAVDQLQSSNAAFALSLGEFGGSITVSGWNSDGMTRPQRDFIPASRGTCLPSDVRDAARIDGACDAGAFEE
jgi:CSLREA domain-containing protein